MNKKIITNTFIVSLIIVLHTTILTVSAQNNLKLQYSFGNVSSDSTKVIDDSENGYNATLINGATIKKMGTFNIVALGAANGYLDLGPSIGSLMDTMQDFSITTYLYIDPTTSVTDNGNFVWSFGNSNNMASNQNGGMFFSAKSTRFAIFPTNWTSEQSVNYGPTFAKGTWKHVAYVQTGTTGHIYLDGILVKSGTISLKPSDLGSTKYNYIGRSLYSSDAYLVKSYLTDFRIYNKAISTSEIVALAGNISNLNNIIFEQQLTQATNALELGDLEEVTTNLKFPFTVNNGITITWSSSNTSVISDEGEVTRPSVGQDTVSVVLTATLTKNGISRTKTFTAQVLPLFNDKISVNRDAIALTLIGDLQNLRTDLVLPKIGIEGSDISWQSSNNNYLTTDGKFLKLAPIGGGKVKIILTANVGKGNYSTQKAFEVYIAEDEGYAAYLFVYFTGNDISQEAIRFALSNDGFTYRALNNDKPVIQSSAISSTGGVRDPHIYRGPDGKYYMVVTDMVSANGWNSNRAMVLLRSTDLINWQSSIVNMQTKYGYSDLHRVWAPQTIFDPQAGKFMIYFSMQRGSGPDIIYYAYANPGFTDIEGEPKQLYFSPTNSSCIDGDIINMDGKYHLFHKTEGNGNGIKKAVSESLTNGFALYDKYLQQTADAVEGSSVFKLINSNEYILMYDMYTSGKYQFTKSTDLLNFKVIDNDISMNFTPRHGTVMPITANEANALTQKWGTPANLVILSADGPYVKKRNVVIDTAHKSVYVPLRSGANLKALDPGLKVIPGATISPAGAVDFSKGPVTYTISINGIGPRQYKVTAKTDHNPIVEGYFADPEILYSNKTGKYYLYPTSDGFTGWSGTYFKTFSSSTLTDWKDEGVILNLPTDVSWGTTSAWAPTIAERKVNGEYKYFYYFCATQKIGVAVSASPTGPFIDSGTPLISEKPDGAHGGQQIDPDVFHDPVSGKYYIYWGNGYMACAELNDDMISINKSSIKIITPNSTFREGSEVFYRNGTYYFLWSENDTRDENYRVRYATSTSPTGPLTIPVNNLVIAKDTAQKIYGTGHNAILQIPNKDEWYIIYHRFTRPKGITMEDAAGYNREVCIDVLKFNPDGSIKQVKSSLEGIVPISTSTNIKKKK